MHSKMGYSDALHFVTFNEADRPFGAGWGHCWPPTHRTREAQSGSPAGPIKMSLSAFLGVPGGVCAVYPMITTYGMIRSSGMASTIRIATSSLVVS